MEKTNIDWVDSTWNPITGCYYTCEFCYARTMVEKYGPTNELSDQSKNAVKIVDLKQPAYKSDTATNTTKKPRKEPYPYGFIPTLHRYRLNDYVAKKARSIFIGSMADIWGDWIPDSWINEIMKACIKGSQHSYLFLTKNPKRYARYFKTAWLDLIKGLDLPDELCLFTGTTITKQDDLSKIDNETLPYLDFLSVEPILEPIDFTKHLYSVDQNKKPYQLKWLIVGAETGDRADKVIAEKEWIDTIVKQCDQADVPIFMKSSLIDIVGEENMRRDYPIQIKNLYSFI